MSNIGQRSRRLGRWFLVNLFVAAVIFGIIRALPDPWLWGLPRRGGAVSASTRRSASIEDLAKERFHPPEAGADRLLLARDPAHGPRTHRGLAAWTCAGSSRPVPDSCGSLGDRRYGGLVRARSSAR